ncbi:MAG TPA: Gfo/Idh/MocA family oxidoreductase [Rudaea sp.]|nr:Gfo/Idh/MocA family oxidoreductase [Rudaea sp.]
MNAQLEPSPRPRLGFLGVGWIGRQRMQALAESGVADVVAIADPHEETRTAALRCAPGASASADLDALLDADLDGIVIATPSGAHAEQAIAALERGLAVFCQKPLTRTAAEAERVIAAARANDRLVGVDFSYRFVAGVSTLRTMIQGGELGELYAIDLAFHNAYGPDKQWFYDIAQSGGGCVMDLGTHLVDLAMWTSGSGGCHELDAKLAAFGKPLAPPIGCVEDYASAQWRLDSGASVRMSCSWRLPAGCDAFIEASFYGTRGGAALRNVGGSFYDFAIERFDGTRRERVAGPPDAWGGRALVHWAERLAAGERFDPEAGRYVEVARTLDRIYGR